MIPDYVLVSARPEYKAELMENPESEDDTHAHCDNKTRAWNKLPRYKDVRPSERSRRPRRQKSRCKPIRHEAKREDSLRREFRSGERLWGLQTASGVGLGTNMSHLLQSTAWRPDKEDHFDDENLKDLVAHEQKEAVVGPDGRFFSFALAIETSGPVAHGRINTGRGHASKFS